MYLADTIIKDRLPEMDIVCDDPNPLNAFNPGKQIQPCSIDLRLSNVFWIPVKGKSIDLRQSHRHEVSPRLHWKKRILNEGDYIILKPGKALFARVCEMFTIPNDCAGKIEGRSSFARMGLGIHFTADFINPGYRGHMPLQLYNYGQSPITIIPLIPICQLILIPLQGTPSRTYRDTELRSKYVDDDGGPSYWWRDTRIKELHARLGEIDKDIRIQDRVLKIIGNQEAEIIERFYTHIDHLPKTSFESADTLLESFLDSENRLHTRDRVINWFVGIVFTTLFSLSLRTVFFESYDRKCFLLWTLTVLCFFPLLHVLTTGEKPYFVKQE